MKIYSYSLGCLTGTAAILLANPLCLAATNQIEDVVLSPQNQGLELRLTTNNHNQEPPSFVTIIDDNLVQTTILNTTLELSEPGNFSQTNPTKGIEQISINQLEGDNTQITFTSASDIPLDSIIEQQGTDLIFELTPQKQSFFSRIPLLSNLSNLKNFQPQLPSFLTSQALKNDQKSDSLNRKTANNADNNYNNEILVPNPEIIIGESTEGFGDGLSTEQNSEQPYLPRAVAPPVGDIAVSNINALSDTVDLGSTAMIPRLVLRDAPVREVLSLLSRQAGLNVVFTANEQEEANRRETGEATSTEGPTISLDLENQSVQEAFDSIMLVSGLNASRRGNIIYIGEKLPSQARNLISRTLRLNQVEAENAALFLASQGAQGQRIIAEVEEKIDPETGRIVQRKELPATLEELGGPAKDEQDKTKALLLRGLQVSTDDRLNSITLIGEPRKVETATAFLTQLDARRRQVAVNVKVLDVNLNNQDFFNSSFSFGVNDTFFVQDQGSAILNFGDTKPPNELQVRNSQFSPAVTGLTLPDGVEGQPFFDVQENSPFRNITPGFNEFTNTISPYARPNFGTNNNPFQPGISDIDIDPEGLIEYEYSFPSLFQFPKRFLAELDARIVTGNAKILTDPTLMVQEGQQATVKLAQNVIESVKTEIDGDSGTRTITPVIAEAGLVLTVNVERVDDNGFVGLSVSPTVSSVGLIQEFDSGGGANNRLNLLSKRELSSGLIRLRDGQTLILSGIIQDQERNNISKVPILGDIPLLGSLFRSSNKTNERAEVIVLLTPQIVDEQAGFGYDYTPGKETRELLRQGGLTLPNNPQQ